MEAAALPAPTTTVRPGGGGGRYGGTQSDGAAAATAASNIRSRSARSSIVAAFITDDRMGYVRASFNQPSPAAVVVSGTYSQPTQPS